MYAFIFSVPTKRGDIEILCYNIIFWLCGSLPWEKLLDPVTVQTAKEKAFANVNDFLKKCGFPGSIPQAVHKFMTSLNGVKFNEAPPYEKLKEILIGGLKKLNHEADGKLRLDNIGKLTQPNFSKATPQKMRKDKVDKVNKVRKSPRTKRIDVSNSIRRNPRDSTIGVVVDRKRCNIKDIEKALENMDSEDEYDVQILKKAKKVAVNDAVRKVMEDTVSEENTEMEVIMGI